MKILYHLIVLFLTIHFVWYLFREKKFWIQVGTAVIVIMFLLRLFLIK
ncbi:hypothetical protein ACFLRX_01915 [Acidobacteriota bacterium]